MQEATVWVAAWQMQCCGNPFKVGDTVEWPAVEWTFDTPLVSGIPPIDFDYDAHANSDVMCIRGLITEIYAVYQTFVLGADQAAYVPAAGKLVEYSGQANGWEKAQGEHQFTAYLVRLSELIVKPTPKRDG